MSDIQKSNRSARDKEKADVDPVAGKTLAEILGEITWLMTQHPQTKDMRLSALERLVMPAIMLQQFHIIYAPVPSGKASKVGSSGTGKGTSASNLQPVAVEIYAMVSDAVAAGLDANPELPLSVADWRSGKRRRTLLKLELIKGTLEGGAIN